MHAHTWKICPAHMAIGMQCSDSAVQADDDVISEVFHSHNLQPPAELRGVSGEVYIGQKVTGIY